MAIEIDLGRLVNQDWMDYVHDPAPARLITILTQVVTGWDYDLDPADPASYDQLTTEQLQAIHYELGRRIMNFTATVRFASAAHEVRTDKPAKKRVKRTKKGRN